MILSFNYAILDGLHTFDKYVLICMLPTKKYALLNISKLKLNKNEK
jgi:hypothetical protein